ELINSGSLTVVTLDKIFRQAQESLIVVNAHRINQGQFPIINEKNKDFYFIQEEEPEKIAKTILDLCSYRIPSYLKVHPLEDIQVITPMRKTVLGVENLNKLLQEQLNPPQKSKKQIYYGSEILRQGDKVMQVRNNYQKEVYNGDIGRIKEINQEEGEMTVVFPDYKGSREVVYGLNELEELDLSYAISVHKSQGSEYPVVVVPVVTQHFILLQRNLIYTGITRARELVVVIGSKKAMGIALRNNRVEERYTLLGERLCSGNTL
ncbi:MAG: ATP-dependent RecD-like DNA helicase, partial [Candidatus Syntrophonatronum acetioxidans]